MTVRIYVEGGGRSSWKACRRGFAELFGKALDGACPFAVIPCGSRQDAFEDYCRAVRARLAPTLLLLVDADEAVSSADSPWLHLARHRQWAQPRGADDESAHLMVRTTEAWLLADLDTLAEFYGPKFQKTAIPSSPDIESVPKDDLESSLRRATRATQKGAYHKTQHGFALLARIDPRKVEKRSRHAKRLFDLLRRLSHRPGRARAARWRDVPRRRP